MSGGEKEGKSSNSCMRCIGCCYCLLFLLIIIAASCVAFYLCTTDKPQAPTYDVKSFVVKSLDIQDDFSLKTEFVIEVKTTNPNKNLGFNYGSNSNVSLLYHDTIISSGTLPAFKQDPLNTTVLKIELAGTSQDGEGSLQEDTKNNKNEGGEIPLVVHVRVPMSVFVGNVAFKEVMAYVTCDVVVDNLEKGKTAKVLENECEPDVDI